MQLSEHETRDRLVRGVQGFYFDGSEALRVTALNAAASVVLAITGRFLEVSKLRPSDFGASLTPATDRTASTLEIPMGEGWLQGLTAIAASGAPLAGQTFVRVDVIRGRGASSTVIATLLQGVLTAAQRLAWPGSPIVSTLAGPGAVRLVAGADPAVNTEWSITVPTGARWRPLAVHATLVTDANAANREATLVLDDGATEFARIPTRQHHAASLTRSYTWSQGVTPGAVATSTALEAALPSAILPAGARIRSVTSAIQAGDNWSAPVALVEEWLEGA